MVRLVCDRTMELGAHLLRAGVPSAPMREEDARALIAEPREKLARLWYEAGILRIEPHDGAPIDTSSTTIDRVEAVILAMVSVLDMLDGLTEEQRYQAMSRFDDMRLERLRERAGGGSGGEGDEGEEEGGEGDEDGGAPPGGDATSLEPVATSDESSTIDGLTIPQATPIIAAETDIELLQTWRETDERKGIHELIDARLDELTRPPE